MRLSVLRAGRGNGTSETENLRDMWGETKLMIKMCEGRAHYYAKMKMGEKCKCGQRTWGPAEQRQWERFMDMRTVKKGIVNG